MKKLTSGIIRSILLAIIIWFIIMNTDGCKKQDTREGWAKSNIDQ